MKRILIATEKPFAPAALDQIRPIIEEAGHELVLLENYTSDTQLLSAVADADALIVRSDKVTCNVIEAASKLRIVVRAGAGYDNLDLEACTRKGIVAMNTPGQNSNAVAELVFGMMIYQLRNRFNGSVGTELRGKMLGIHGYGNVGFYVAKIAQGFGMEVYAFDPYVEDEKMLAEGVKPLPDVQTLYSTCQYVSLHIPANAKTHRAINYNLLSKMPKEALLINTARKEEIDEEGIIQLMEERDDFRYLSDITPDNKMVFEEKFPGRFLFTAKKMGAQTSEANINAGVAAAKQIIRFFKDGDESYRVNN